MVLTGNEAESPAIKEEIPHDHLFKVTGLSSTNLEKLAQDPPVDFEDAIAATGFGKFNALLMLATLSGFWSAVSVTSSVTYIFTQAQCQLGLSLLDMGTINAMTYGGMISSAMLWGFLSDTLGRRPILVWALITTGLVEIAASMSQSFPMLLVTRFASGFFFNGPFAVLLSYLAELHRTELRARIMLFTSLFYTFASTTLPLLAWSLLAEPWDLYICGGKFVIHSWNIFLLVTAMLPLLTGVAFIFFPESPKFLMSRGRNDEAMKVFHKIFVLNTGKTADEFPVKALVEEKSEQARGVAALRGGYAQLAPLFRTPHVGWLILICSVQIGTMFGSNTIRLWYPQLSAMIGSANGSLCAAIAPHPTSPDVEETCVPIDTDMLTYLQSAIVGAGSVVTFTIGGAVINRCGKKFVVCACGVLSAAVIMTMPLLGSGPVAVAGLVTTAMALTALSAASLSSITVDLFPTSLRVMAMATFLMMGRMGTITGTVTFPALIGFGCYPPFITIAAVLTACGCACIFLPNTTLKKLE